MVHILSRPCRALPWGRLEVRERPEEVDHPESGHRQPNYQPPLEALEPLLRLHRLLGLSELALRLDLADDVARDHRRVELALRRVDRLLLLLLLLGAREPREHLLHTR